MQILSCASFTVHNNGTVMCDTPQIIEVTELTIEQSNELFAAAALVLVIAWTIKRAIKLLTNER